MGWDKINGEAYIDLFSLPFSRTGGLGSTEPKSCLFSRNNFRRCVKGTWSSSSIPLSELVDCTFEPHNSAIPELSISRVNGRNSPPKAAYRINKTCPIKEVSEFRVLKNGKLQNWFKQSNKGEGG